MLEKFGELLELTKSFTWREQSESVVVTYSHGGSEYDYEQLDADITHLLERVAISYIHPQEGAALLQKAQDKFKKRLFHNWGRHASVSERLASVEGQWDALRATANTYLSRALTERIRDLWPGSEIKVDLPARLEDVVAISDIAFRGSPNQPELSLTSHGTGAQSIILYQTHFILDSDRSLHQGMYFPIWLVEEPESFLHADIAFQLGRLLASDAWQSQVQMLISTHSPIILAGSKQSSDQNHWALFERHAPVKEVPVKEVTDQDVADIGRMMGDANFDVYFSGATAGPVVLIEDKRDQTKAAFESAGVPVTKALGGITEVKKYLTVYLGVKEAIGSDAYVIVDGDNGKSEIQHLLNRATIVDEAAGWQRYRLSENLFVITLPEHCAVENLYTEWNDVLDETIDDLLNEDLSIREHVPARLSRVVDRLRRDMPIDHDEARAKIAPIQDVKDRFWHRAERDNWGFAPQHIQALKRLLVGE